MAERGAFSTRIGFLFAAVGSAVGLGNLWRFPYLVSSEGGAAFMFVYLALLFVIGLPALMAELSLGRRSRMSAIDAFRGGGRTKSWGWAGVLAISGAVLLLSYYSVIAGWALRYLAGAFAGAYFEDAGGYFGDISIGPGAVLTHAIFMAITVAIVLRGVSRGIEKANLVMMPVLFLTILALVIYGNLQDGAQAGRDFYLDADFSAVDGGMLSNAAGQTFFSIGLGIGTMLTYSSYLGRDNNLQSTGLTIGLADTSVAILAGFMVFPLLFSLGLDDLVNPSNAGNVGGLFIVLPTAFGEIGGVFGHIIAVGFFVMLSFAALSSAISLLEVPVSAVLDRQPAWGRPRTVLLLGLAVYTLGLPSALDLTILGYADLLVSNVLLLTGGLLLTVYVGWVRPEILDELTFGITRADGRKGLDWSAYFRPVIRFALPVLLLALLVLGVMNFFASL